MPDGCRPLMPDVTPACMNLRRSGPPHHVEKELRRCWNIDHGNLSFVPFWFQYHCWWYCDWLPDLTPVLDYVLVITKA